MRLAGKVALVTGGARGQGAAAARRFVAEGARVVLGDVLDDEGGAVAAELGDAAVYRHLDVTSEADWMTAAETARGRYGGLDVLVSNAGIAPRPRAIVETAPDDYRHVLEVNLVGSFLGIRACAPHMTRDGGSIVLVSSVNGYQGAPGIAGYVSSKFALRGLARSAAVELGRDRVRVNCVCPGPIDTAMMQPEAWDGFDMRPAVVAGLALGRMGRPEDVAGLVCWLASDESAFCTGADFVADGGLLAGPYLPIERRE